VIAPSVMGVKSSGRVLFIRFCVSIQPE